MISLNSPDNSEKPVKVHIEAEDALGREKRKVEAYLCGHSELRKQYAYKISSGRFYGEPEDNVYEYESVYIKYRILAEQFQYDCETMSVIYVIYPKTKEIFSYDIASYNVNFEENEVLFDYTGFQLYKAEKNDETFNLWSMIGFENISKDMLEEHLRKLKLIR